MDFIKRIAPLSEHLEKKSCFLFGPRNTGKSFWIKKLFPNSLFIDLLLSKKRLVLEKDPSELIEMVKFFVSQKKDKGLTFVIIDEIQKIPALLDEIHHMIEEDFFKNVRFLLTGSSARKIKLENGNMLAGRARKLFFFPLTWKELFDAGKFDLNHFLLYGGIPSIYLSKNPQDILDDYINTYLQDEIIRECRIRNISGFEKFLVAAAQLSGELINYANLSRDAQIPQSSIKNYFQVLEDTLVCYRLPPWNSPKLKSIQTEKFYLFDIGLKWFLSNTQVILPKTTQFGSAFEHFILQEIISWSSYSRSNKKISFWRDDHMHEIDVILGDDYAIEIKSTQKVDSSYLKNLRFIAKDNKWTGKERLLVSLDTNNTQTKDGILCMYYEYFLKNLWNNLYL